MDLTSIFKRKTKNLNNTPENEGDHELELKLDEMKKQFPLRHSFRELVNGYMQSVDSNED